MAVSTVTPAGFPAQPPSATRTRTRSLQLAVVQLPVRKWQKPWRHQSAILLFAKSAEHARLRLKRERRITTGEHVLRIVPVGVR